MDLAKFCNHLQMNFKPFILKRLIADTACEKLIAPSISILKIKPFVKSINPSAYIT